MVVTATVHVYFDDGTHYAVKVHNPEIEKYLATEPLSRPVQFRYEHCNPTDTVYEITGLREWSTSDKEHLLLTHTSHDIGSYRLPTQEERDADYQSWLRSERCVSDKYYQRYPVLKTLEIGGKTYDYEALQNGGFSEVLFLLDQARVEKALEELEHDPD